jgi:hypothetical protein
MSFPHITADRLSRVVGGLVTLTALLAPPVAAGALTPNDGCGSTYRHVVRRTTVRLYGTAGFRDATGLARYERRTFSSCGDSRDRLRVTVSDAPLRAGTTLTIYIDDTRFGSVQLDTHGDGRLTLRADRLPRILRLEGHPYVTARLADGQLVLTNGR